MPISAFQDLVAFENALRADMRLKEEDKLRRWKVRALKRKSHLQN